MNKEKLKVLADAIENAPEQTFDMATFFDPGVSEDSDDWTNEFVAGGLNASCGTAGCIAGWACNIFLPPGEAVHENRVSGKAIKLLEPEDVQEEYILLDLFTSATYWRTQGYGEANEKDAIYSIAQVTKEMAVQELRRLAEA